MTIIIILGAWILVSQFVAWMIAGDDPDKALDTWSAVFLLVPMGICYAVVFIIAFILRTQQRRKVTVEDVVM